MIIQLMGPQACGKGTQGEFLSKALNLPLLGVGDLLRDIPQDNPHYKEVNEQMQKGILVDFQLTANVIKHELKDAKYKNGYILDGWGRIMNQFKYFDPSPDIVIFINIPREETLKRILGRARPDDTPDAINKRLEIYQTETLPVIEKYRNEKRLLEIDGLGTPQEVFGRILKGLEQFGQ